MLGGVIGFVMLALGVLALGLTTKKHMEERNNPRANSCRDMDDCPSFPMLLVGYIAGSIFATIGLIVFLVFTI